MQNEYNYFRNQNPIKETDFLKLKANKQKYTDELFKPNDYSLYSIDNITNDYYNKKNGKIIQESLENEFNSLNNENKKENIIWRRLSDIAEFQKVYDELISYEQVEQGLLGDCFLIAEISSLCRFPFLMMGDKEKNFLKKNLVHIFYNIKYEEIG